ncbi:MAG TPA: DUF1343 domain-containing protein [Gammaproteobacteria bacterium]|nr:DUF1343 domain-containing protein [Gammaproteobacteria bacterium]
MIKKIMSLFLLLVFSTLLHAAEVIKPAAEQPDAWLPLLKNKRVAVFANHSSLIGKESLVDVLLKNKIHVVKLFAPEHGFRGEVDSRIKDSVDTRTGLPIISLYGKKLTPTADDLRDVDVILFDIQDVGVRFYTYISSLQKVMEAAVNNNKPLIILDRPNPNGFYVDGPVLDRQYRSFTGMQPVPVVYGMTIGEYANMLVGEKWLNVTPKEKAARLQLTVIPCINYTHNSLYIPPVKPSPNLPTIQSIYLYPSLGMMEGTVMSVGRGTRQPFEVFGHPRILARFHFVPTPKPGAESPRFQYKICYGWNLAGNRQAVLQKIQRKLQIRYLLQAYRSFPDKKHFFAGFNWISGNSQLEKQIRAGLSEKQIRLSWQPQLDKFKQIRKKYLLYPDFTQEN